MAAAAVRGEATGEAAADPFCGAASAGLAARFKAMAFTGLDADAGFDMTFLVATCTQKLLNT